MVESRSVLALSIFLFIASALATGEAPAANGQPAPAKNGCITLKGHDKHVAALAFSPDGKTLATGGLDGMICLWEVAAGKQLRKWVGHKGREWEPHVIGVYSLVFSQDGKTLYSSGVEKVIRCWDPATGKEVGKLEGHTDRVATLALSPDGKLLASGSYDKTIRLWDVATGKEVRQLLGHVKRVTSVSFSPDGIQLVSGGITDDPITTPDGGVIISGWGDHVRLWDVSSGKLIRKLPARGNMVAISADGATIAAGSLVPEFHGLPEGKTALRGIDVITLSDRTTGEEFRRITLRGTIVSFSANSQLLATGYGAFCHFPGSIGPGNVDAKKANYRVCLWDMLVGREILLCSEDSASVISFSPTGTHLAIGNYDGDVVLSAQPGNTTNNNPKPHDFTPQEQNRLWNNLSEQDSTIAYRAVWELTAAPDKAVLLCKGRLRPFKQPEENRVKMLMNQLVDTRFSARDEATTELEKLGCGIERAIRQALAEKPSLETLNRLEGVLRTVRKTVPVPEELAALRAIQFLEIIGSGDAQQLLKILAQGSPYALPTQHARAALVRLERK